MTIGSAIPCSTTELRTLVSLSHYIAATRDRTEGLQIFSLTLSQLSYSGTRTPRAGLEPATPGLEVQCAIHCANGAGLI